MEKKARYPDDLSEQLNQPCMSNESLQNIPFYDVIADDYDSYVEEIPSAAETRKEIAEIVLKNIRKGNLLDFGGGTGLDLDWLTAHEFQIFFCEPSQKMREKAMLRNSEKLHSEKITFLQGQQSDFRNWPAHPPFEKKMDAILANFAVLNNIFELRI